MFCSSSLEITGEYNTCKFGYDYPTMHPATYGLLVLIPYLITGSLATSWIDTQINSPQKKPNKYDNIMTGQYMESKKQFKLDLIRIDNTAHVRDIVIVNASMFQETTM